MSINVYIFLQILMSEKKGVNGNMCFNKSNETTDKTNILIKNYINKDLQLEEQAHG